MLVAAGGWWAGRAAWRLHKQLITLDVRNMPLAEVLSRIEWQTWKKIRAEKTLNARITLHVTEKPLPYVLNRVAEQSGARWSKVYAVYESPGGRKALETALAGDGKLEAAGWTKVAPKAPDFDQPETGGGGPIIRTAKPDSFPATTGPGGGQPSEAAGPTGGSGGMMMFRRDEGGGVMFSRNASGQTEMWSPEELVMETPLSARLGTEDEPMPSPQAAEEAARKVKGKWTTYFAIRKSIMGVGFAGPGPGRPGPGSLKHDPNDRFARLTPEQRVQRARERRRFETGPGTPAQ